MRAAHKERVVSRKRKCVGRDAGARLYLISNWLPLILQPVIESNVAAY
jgi:hypothetical protein